MSRADAFRDACIASFRQAGIPWSSDVLALTVQTFEAAVAGLLEDDARQVARIRDLEASIAQGKALVDEGIQIVDAKNAEIEHLRSAYVEAELRGQAPNAVLGLAQKEADQARAEVARLTARVDELLAANTAEVERRRGAEAARDGYLESVEMLTRSRKADHALLSEAGIPTGALLHSVKYRIGLLVRERDEARAEVERLKVELADAERGIDLQRDEIGRIGASLAALEAFRSDALFFIAAGELDYDGRVLALQRDLGFSTKWREAKARIWPQVGEKLRSLTTVPCPNVVTVESVPCCGCPGRVHSGPGGMGDGRDASYPIAAPAPPQATPDHAALLAEALRKAKAKFQEYERIHLAKKSPCAAADYGSRGEWRCVLHGTGDPEAGCLTTAEAQEKAAANRAMAEMCEAALSAYQRDAAQPVEPHRVEHGGGRS